MEINLLHSKSCMRWRWHLKASHMRWDGQNQLQISAPLPLKEILRMIPLSAQAISVDSPFKLDVCKQLYSRSTRNKFLFCSSYRKQNELRIWNCLYIYISIWKKLGSESEARLVLWRGKIIGQKSHATEALNYSILYIILLRKCGSTYLEQRK